MHTDDLPWKSVSCADSWMSIDRKEIRCLLLPIKVLILETATQFPSCGLAVLVFGSLIGYYALMLSPGSLQLAVHRPQQLSQQAPAGHWAVESFVCLLCQAAAQLHAACNLRWGCDAALCSWEVLLKYQQSMHPRDLAVCR